MNCGYVWEIDQTSEEPCPAFDLEHECILQDEHEGEHECVCGASQVQPFPEDDEESDDGEEDDE